jgi:DNA polymerase alpha subunit A
MWSKLGRLNRSTMPKLDRRGKTFGFGADPAIMSCVAGRLLCDTYLCSRDLLKEVKVCREILLTNNLVLVLILTNYFHWFFQVSYSLTHLAKTQLNQSRKEVAPHDVPKMFQTAKSLMELVCATVPEQFFLSFFFYQKIVFELFEAFILQVKHVLSIG